MRNSASLLVALSFAVLTSAAFSAEGAHKDGYSFRNGKVVMMRGGHESFVTAEVTLGNGSRLSPDGFIISREGKRERFQDDRWITLEGDYDVVEVASDDFDGYYLEGGQVYVIRDRRPVLVTVEITLNDGSRISPSGEIVLKDGTRNRMSEGQRISKEGKHVEGKHTAAAHTPVAPAKSVDANHKTEEPAKNRQPEAKAPATEKREERAQPGEKREERAQPNEKREEKSEPNEKREEKK
jgi:hypothetical protein